MKQHLKFRDADGQLINLDITLEDGRLSISGDMGSSAGQIVDSIKPKGTHQKRLIEIWKRYHLNDLNAGTRKQTDALKSWKDRPDGWSYEQDKKYLDSLNPNGKPLTAIEYTAISQMRDKFLSEIAIISDAIKITQEDFNNNYHIIKKTQGGMYITLRQGIPEQKSFYHTAQRFKNTCDKMLKTMNENLEKLNKEFDTWKLKTLLYDVHENKVYEYGHGWIKRELPENLENEIIELCRNITDKEQDDKNALNGGSWDDIDDDKIKALGQNLDLSPNEAREYISESYENVYSYSGIDYFVGTEEETRKAAQEYLTDDTYIYQLWVEKEIKEGRAAYIKNIDDWADWVIDIDGYGSVLNLWDGSESTQEINNIDYYIIRR